MVKNNLCSYCGSNNVQIVDSYKSLYYSCKNCGVLKRNRKEKYIFDNFFLKYLIKKSPLNKLIGSSLLANDKINEDSNYSSIYEYYAEVLNENQTIKGTKWENIYNTLSYQLNESKIEVANKTILDISGGPGLIAKELDKHAKKVYVTEFSDISCKAMKESLELEVLKFDYSKDNISKLFSEKFDIVLIINSIFFCHDIKSFFESLKYIIEENGFIIIYTINPSLGTIIKEQFVDYTYEVLYPPSIIEEELIKNGFKKISVQDFSTRSYDRVIGGELYSKNKIVNSIWGILRTMQKYYIKKSKNKLIKNDLTIVDTCLIFKKISPNHKLKNRTTI